MTHQEKFHEFHRSNPHVYRNLVLMARQYRDRQGKQKIGIATLWETLRWNYLIGTESTDFKLNNNHKAFYARLIMDCNHDLQGMFDVREQKAA